ncbi:hypothetical protein CKM354_000038800 [Cercospora kikuchii]|uniref:Uncharacterized protein n=1 Tax=Cercospora kikuchii TaxID=84275 RepID=A0A9P3C8V6_9PEZI|nr:uncharacterized protein CKM354_000038800 [Cercospora kikuchii]GIZ36922.1 hypothetical protein CKM354_000038800 [Cercospora kikuchii]
MERNHNSLFGRRGPEGQPVAPEDYQATFEVIIAWCTTLAVTAITRENELRGQPPPTSRILAPFHRMLVNRRIRRLRRFVARELGILNDELARLSNEHTTVGFVERLAQSLEEFYENVPTGFTKSVIDSISQRAIGASDMDENGNRTSLQALVPSRISGDHGKNDNKDNSNDKDESTAPSGSGAATEDKSSAVASSTVE